MAAADRMCGSLPASNVLSDAGGSFVGTSGADSSASSLMLGKSLALLECRPSSAGSGCGSSHVGPPLCSSWSVFSHRAGLVAPFMLENIKNMQGGDVAVLHDQGGAAHQRAAADHRVERFCARAIISRAVAMSDHTEPAVHIEPPSVPHAPAAEHVLRNVFRHLYTGKDVQGASPHTFLLGIPCIFNPSVP